jgi:hypothetical protein
MPHILRLRKDGPVANTGWFVTGTKYTSTDVQSINDPAGANTGVLLTSIPSPFARMHLFETAFNIVNSTDHNGIQNGMGVIAPTKYHEMVSHCLDMLEIFYDFDRYKKSLKANGFILACHQFHLNDTQNHQNKTDAVANLESSPTPRTKLLGQTLRTFLTADAKSMNFEYFNYLYVITINSVPIGGTSPISLFYTVDNIQSIMPAGVVLNSLDGQALLSNQIRPLHTRSPEFQKFVHTLFMCHVPNLIINEKMKAMYNYVMNSKDYYIQKNSPFFQEISTLYNQRDVQAYGSLFEPIVDNGNNITILNVPQQGALTINQKKVVSSQNFQSDFMMLSKREKKALVLSSERDYMNWRLTPTFIITDASFKNQVPRSNPGELANRTLPIDGTVFPFVTVFDFFEDKIITIEGGKSDNLSFFEGTSQQSGYNYLLPIKKDYFDYFDIEDLVKFCTIQAQNDLSIKVSLDIPTTKGIVTLNKTYTKDERVSYSSQNPIGFAIYPLLRSSKEELNNMYHIMTYRYKKNVQNEIELSFFKQNKIISSKKTLRVDATESIYIHKTEEAFDYFTVSISGFSGIIVPKWYERTPIDTTKSFTCALDFGTTSSHVEIQVAGTSVKPIALTNQKLVARLGNYPDLFQELFFMPNVGTEYTFPNRTVTNHKEHSNPTSEDWLNEINIAFYYGKQTGGSLKETTNLKWQIKRGDNASMGKAEAFITQMLFMLKNYIVANNSDPQTARIVRFLPLSMPKWLQSQYNELWDKQFRKIFRPTNAASHIDEDNHIRLSESQAPFYYYELGITNRESIVCVDIGGGTTDVVFFVKQQEQKPKPTHATSFFFGANTLYGTGYNRDYDAKNPIHTLYEKEMISRIQTYVDKHTFKQVLRGIHDELIKKGDSSEIINFWLTHDDKIKLIHELKANSKYKFIFLFYYASIIYHIAQTIKQKGIKCPNYICLSGNGCRFVEVLDNDRLGRRPNLTIFTKALMKSVIGDNANRLEGIISAENPKEATCKGGIEYVNSRTSTDDSPIETALLGTNDSKSVDNYQNYKELLDKEKTLKTDIQANVLTFISELEKIGQERTTNYNVLFGTSFNDYGKLKTLLDKNCEGYIDAGLERYMENPQDPVVEPLFFYPITGLIYDIGHELKSVQNVDF